MRKRKYSHRDEDSYRPDTLREDIDKLWLQLHPEKLRRFEKSAHAAPEEEGEAMPLATTHNIVGTALLKSELLPLQLRVVSELVPNLIYDKQKFAAITLKIAEPNCTVLLFTSGKMVLTGCKSFTECVVAAHEVRKILQQGFPTHKIALVDVSIQNVVANADVRLGEGDSIDLDLMLAEHKVHCTYLKNMFPGLIFRPNQSPVVLLIFKSGKVVITGGKSLADIQTGWRGLWPTIRSYIRRRG